MNRNIIIGLVAALILFIIFAGLELAPQNQRIKTIRWQGLQGAAQYDNFYIAERFLREKGLNITRKKSIKHFKQILNEPYQTIFINHTSMLQSSEIEQLLTWVKQGHQLITEAQNTNMLLINNKSSNKPMGLLNQAGITVIDCIDEKCLQCQPIETSEKLSEKHPPNINKTAKTDTIDNRIDKLLAKKDTRHNAVTFIANHQPITLNQRYFHHYISGNKAQKIRSQKGSCQEELYGVFSYGQGKIVVYAQSVDIFSSAPHWGMEDSIFSYHNATYLHWLLHQAGNPERILWYDNDVFPSAWEILWRYWSFSLIMAAILLLVWIWKNSRRYGPQIIENKHTSLSITRHLQATGQFYYESEAKQTLLDSCYEQLSADISRHIPMANRLSKAELIDKLALITKLSTHEIKPIIYRQPPNSEAAFIRLTQTINHIRKRL